MAIQDLIRKQLSTILLILNQIHTSLICFEILVQKYGVVYHLKPRRRPLLISSREIYIFMHFRPETMTPHAESNNSDLQHGLDGRLQHTQH